MSGLFWEDTSGTVHEVEVGPLPFTWEFPADMRCWWMDPDCEIDLPAPEGFVFPSRPKGETPAPPGD